MTFVVSQLVGPKFAAKFLTGPRTPSRFSSVMHVIAFVFVACGPLMGAAKSKDSGNKPSSSTSMRCIAAAAKYHKVNQTVLSAILKIESAYNPGAVNRNTDGSVDVGIGQMNSVHFKELATHGITPTDLMDPCVGSYVAAWHLGKQVQLHGNTWFAIGAYHSVTPVHNSRYQAQVYNAMVDMRAVPGPKLGVAPVELP